MIKKYELAMVVLTALIWLTVLLFIGVKMKWVAVFIVLLATIFFCMMGVPWVAVCLWLFIAVVAAR